MSTKRPVFLFGCYHKVGQTTAVNLPIFDHIIRTTTVYRQYMCNRSGSMAFNELSLLISMLVIESLICLHEYVLFIETEGLLS